MNDFIKIEFWNSCNLDIYYQNGFTQWFYLDSDLIAPDYELDQEGYEDGDQEFVPTFQKVKKKYNVEVILPEYLVHALTLMQLHDNIYVTRKTGETVKLIDVSVTHEIIQCYYRVNISFSIDFLRSDCCQAVRCLESSHENIDGRYSYASAQWETPQDVPVPQGARYLFYDDGTEYRGEIYSYDRGRGLWTVELQVEGDVVVYGELSLYYDGYLWRQYPTCEQDGNYLKGFALENTFVQLQEDQAGTWTDIEEPVTEGVFSGQGVDVTAYIGSDVRVWCYNHSCDYGYSESVTLS